MTTVTGKLIGAANPQRVEMRAELVDVTGKPAVGYVPSLDGELVRPVPIEADSSGAWTVNLTANTLIESTSGDTLWAVQEGRAKDGTPILTYIAVPETGSWWVGDIRADLSTTITGQSTVVYLAGQPGPAGPEGAAGPAGAAGQSAYQIAVAGGFTGTEAEWLASLVGPQGATGPQGPQPPLGAAGAGDTIALKSTDPTTTNARTPTAHKTTHATGGTDPLTPADIGAEPAGAAAAAVAPLDTRLDTVEAALPLKADKSGATFTGQVNVVGANLAVLRGDNTGGYQFRVTGGGVNLDLHGDVFISHFSNAAFTADETYMMRWEAAGPHLIGRVQFGSTPYNTVHDIDSATGVAGLGAKNGLVNVRFCGRRTATGAPTTGTWTAGDVLQDSAGVWWFCTAGGTPGTWTSPPATPTAHAASHATGGNDPIAPADIGAVPTTRQITAGTGLTGGGTLAADRTLAVAYGTSAGTAAAGDDARITGALQASGGTISGNLQVTGNALGQSFPAAHGVAAWCYDPALAVNSTQLTAGTLYLVRVNIAAAVTATKIYWWVANTGSGATTNQNWVGLYSSAGSLLASANVDTGFSSATLKTTTITSTALAAGSFYWVGLLFNASVTPTLTRGSGWTGVDAAANLGLAASAYRFAKNGTGLTALPSSIAPSSNVGSDIAGPWVAVGA